MRVMTYALALSLALAASSAFSAARRPAAPPFPSGPGQAQVTTACAMCHAPTIITGKHYSEEKWGEVVDQMITRGAKVSDADYDMVVAYLARNFGAVKP